MNVILSLGAEPKVALKSMNTRHNEPFDLASVLRTSAIRTMRAVSVERSSRITAPLGWRVPVYPLCQQAGEKFFSIIFRHDANMVASSFPLETTSTSK